MYNNNTQLFLSAPKSTKRYKHNGNKVNNKSYIPILTNMIGVVTLFLKILTGTTIWLNTVVSYQIHFTVLGPNYIITMCYIVQKKVYTCDNEKISGSLLKS